MLSKLRTDKSGFTLIELMIVVAIIGILMAIAVPNFISYRNKAYCSATEKDANSIASAVSEYFAIPSNTTISVAALQGGNTSGKVYCRALLSNNNTWTLVAASPNTAITITVTDVSTRCPNDYQQSMNAANDPNSFWAGGVYTKVMTLN